jgi:hypothetical protein
MEYLLLQLNQLGAKMLLMEGITVRLKAVIPKRIGLVVLECGK